MCWLQKTQNKSIHTWAPNSCFLLLFTATVFILLARFEFTCSCRGSHSYKLIQSSSDWSPLCYDETFPHHQVMLTDWLNKEESDVTHMLRLSHLLDRNVIEQLCLWEILEWCVIIKIPFDVISLYDQCLLVYDFSMVLYFIMFFAFHLVPAHNNY